MTWLTYGEFTHPFLCWSLQEAPSYSASINRKDVLTHMAWSGPEVVSEESSNMSPVSGMPLSTAANLYFKTLASEGIF